MRERKRVVSGYGNFNLPKHCFLLAIAVACPAVSRAQSLPDAPSALLGYTLQAAKPAAPQQAGQLPPDIAAPDNHQNQAPKTPPCREVSQSAVPGIPWLIQSPGAEYPVGTPCSGENPLQPIVNGKRVLQLTPELKGYLAIRNVVDPFNLITVAGYSGIVIASNSHTDYGPGFAGWGRLAGYSMVEDMQSEFFGTFAIPSLVHEDPRYHRMSGKPFRQRLAHALIHTVVSQHDDGTPMPNYATLLTYPISAELSNLYVPGIAVNAPSTAKRIAAGYATDPVGPLIAEFLPDIARHIHIHVIFVQQILQKVATNQPNVAP